MNSRAIEDYKSTLRLRQIQRETLVGLLLGDACLETADGGRTYRLKIEQAARHEAYVFHLYAVFREWVLSPPRKRKTSEDGSRFNWVFQTVSHPALRFYAHSFYSERKKRVPKLIHRWLTPRGLAYWFMDHGSMKPAQSKGVILNTQGFSRPELERLSQVLQSKFDLQTSVRRQPDGYQIYVSGKSFEDFVRLVEPYVLPEMTYKVPSPRRTQLPKR